MLLLLKPMLRDDTDRDANGLSYKCTYSSVIANSAATK